VKQHDCGGCGRRGNSRAGKPATMCAVDANKLLAGREKPVAIVAAFFLLAAVVLLDYVTGWEVSLTIFYLPPIVLVAWFVGRRAGVLFAFLGALVWILIDALSGNPQAYTLVRFWNALVLAGYFVATVIIMAKLKVALEHERNLSRSDPTTGVANTRAFYEWSAKEVERARRYHHPITFVYVDCDDFKAVNDQHGHAAGDEVLRDVARTLQDVVRDLDLVARVGGDEFAIVLTETDRTGAQVVVGRLREALRGAMARRGWALTFSMGVATFMMGVTSVEDALRKADDLMYFAKRRGKSTVEFATFGDAFT
jgi:diguanylate cyclase (GGDEF)-like protein